MSGPAGFIFCKRPSLHGFCGETSANARCAVITDLRLIYQASLAVQTITAVSQQADQRAAPSRAPSVTTATQSNIVNTACPPCGGITMSHSER